MDSARPAPAIEQEDVSVAALLALPFAGYVLALQVALGPSPAQWSSADPILTVLPREANLWLVPALTLAALVWWWRHARPGRRHLERGVRGALLGIIVVALAVGSLRLLVGTSPPAFIPPEESAEPGFQLSMVAGLAEEVLCRLALLPALYFGLRSYGRPILAMVASVAITGLTFALWHMISEPAFSWRFFVARLLIPGCAMSVIWLRNPSMAVIGHCSAHLWIPMTFAGES